MSLSYISKILKESSHIRVYKKIKKPKMTEVQMKSGRPYQKPIYKYRGLIFMLDDERFFTLSNSVR